MEVTSKIPDFALNLFSYLFGQKSDERDFRLSKPQVRSRGSAKAIFI